MKHRLLSLAIVIIAGLPAQAQLRSFNTIVRTDGYAAPQPAAGSELPQSATAAPARSSRFSNAKMTGAAFYTQTFPALPAGWSVTANAGTINGWRWANAAPTGTGNNFPINGLINSATKSNGWLLYNADSVLTNAGSTRPFGGAITSVAIPVGAAHTAVMLSFQQYYRFSTGDECYVDVSANGTTWTTFPIYPNTLLTQFGFLYSNPTITTLNISSVVGGQANAYIRFRFNSTAAQYSFNWLIDDLTLYDADPTDVGIAYSGIASASASGSGFSTGYGYTSIPLRFADNVFPVTYLSNYGLSAAAGTVVTARYFLGGTLLTTQTMNAPTLPIGGRDSFLAFNVGYKPTAVGDYVVALSINPAGDAVSGNNADTIRFSVTDTVYASHGSRFTERNCYLNRPSTSTLLYWGARFTISNGQRDTITSVSAAFRPETFPGEQVQAQLYQATGSGATYDWTPLAATSVRTLGASDISTAGNVVMTTIPFRVTGGNIASLILGDGDYAVVLTTVNSTKDVAVYSMVPPVPTAPAVIGYQGQSGTSPNDNSYSFAAGIGIATGLAEVPLIHPNFGTFRNLVQVPETARIMLGVAFPNPANTSVRIPVVLAETATAQLTLSNTVGQVVDRINLGRMNAGVMQVASISTNYLPAGVYFYTVRAEGSQASGRIVVSH